MRKRGAVLELRRARFAYLVCLARVVFHGRAVPTSFVKAHLGNFLGYREPVPSWVVDPLGAPTKISDREAWRVMKQAGFRFYFGIRRWCEGAGVEQVGPVRDDILPGKPICVYDNPGTMARECWHGKKLLVAYSALILMDPKFKGGDWFFFGANVGPWKAGAVHGDPTAIPEWLRPEWTMERRDD